MTIIAERPVPAAAQIKHLQRLENESISIMREGVTEFRNPVMRYSIGKESGSARSPRLRLCIPRL